MKSETSKKKKAPILVQVGIFATILFVSSLISAAFPPSFPVPTPVVGLLLLYLLLTFKVIKLEWVDSFGSFLISIIAFFFVPSGISLIGSLDVMKAQGVQIIVTVILSTIIMLVVTYFVSAFFIKIRRKITNTPAPDATTSASITINDQELNKEEK